MFEGIKRKIKLAKIGTIIITLIFIFTVVSNLFLIFAYFSLKSENKNINSELNGLKNIIKLSE